MDFSPEAAKRSTVLGAIVLTVIFGGVTAVVVASRIRWQETREWRVYCPYSAGANGLKVGTPVLVGGWPQGMVTEIIPDSAIRPRVHMKAEAADERGDQPPAPEPAADAGDAGDDESDDAVETGGVTCIFTLDASVTLRTNARIVKESDVLGSGTVLDIISVGRPISSPTPGKSDLTSRLAPPQNPLQPFVLTVRRDTIEGILGSEHARDFRTILRALGTVRDVFVGSPGTGDVRTGGAVGPAEPSEVLALTEEFQRVKALLQKDASEWNASVDSIQARWSLLRELTSRPTGDPGLLARATAWKESLVGVSDSVASEWAELPEPFAAARAQADRIGEALGPIGTHTSLVRTTFMALLPRLGDSLWMTKVQYKMAADQLWIALNTDKFTTLVRVFQPFTTADREALLLVLAAGATAQAAEGLQTAVNQVNAALAHSDGAPSPELKRRAAARLEPALRRYRDALKDLLERLDRAVPAGARQAATGR